MRFHSSRRSPSESDECRMATASPKCARNRRANIGVREISGTSISAVLPQPTAARTARMKISVFRLAAASHAGQQERRVAAFVQFSDDLIERRLLFLIEPQVAVVERAVVFEG